MSALGKRMKNGDNDACYRTNWELSPVRNCRKNRTKWLKFLCMDDCPADKGYVICDTLGFMCGTPSYCNTIKEEIVSDLISTGVTIALLAGTGGGLGLLTLFSNILALTEKFAHPRCDQPVSEFKAIQSSAVAKLKK